MAKHRKTVGTGITEREVVVYDGEDAIPALHKSLARWEVARKKGGGDYGAASLHVIEQCLEIIASTDVRRYETDSAADFAQRIISNHKKALAAINRGDADAAALFAYDVGVLAAQAKMKQVWERHALRGAKNASTLKEGLKIANKKKQGIARSSQMKLQARADEIWAQNKYLSKSNVAARIAAKLGGNPDTIRRKITHK